ncbi:MAG TPA: ribokinase [Spirochaetes bacterium]|nr:ribokinase [Spirochaetota bacterium]
MSDQRCRILIVGSVNMDLVLQVERVPGTGENLIGSSYSYISGGKGANQAVAAARLGMDVTFVGRTGNDAHGQKLIHGLNREGISTELMIQDPDNPSGLAVIMVEPSGQNRILVYPGSNMAIREEEVERAFKHTYDAVIMNLEISDRIIGFVCGLAKNKGIPVVLDAGPVRTFDLSLCPGLKVLSPNESEAAALSGLPCTNPDEAVKAAARLADISNAGYVVIKLGAEGAVLWRNGKSAFFPAYTVEAVDATAAGDAFTSGLTSKYLETGDMDRAIRYANAVGALAVTRLGAQPSLPSAAEVAAFLEHQDNHYDNTG